MKEEQKVKGKDNDNREYKERIYWNRDRFQSLFNQTVYERNSYLESLRNISFQFAFVLLSVTFLIGEKYISIIDFERALKALFIGNVIVVVASRIFGLIQVIFEVSLFGKQIERQDSLRNIWSKFRPDRDFQNEYLIKKEIAENVKRLPTKSNEFPAIFQIVCIGIATVLTVLLVYLAIF